MSTTVTRDDVEPQLRGIVKKLKDEGYSCDEQTLSKCVADYLKGIIIRSEFTSYSKFAGVACTVNT